MSLSSFVSFPPSPPSSLYKESTGRRDSMMESSPFQQNGIEDSSSLPARSRAGTVSSNNQLSVQQAFESPRSINLASPALSTVDSSYLSPLAQDPASYLPTPVSNSYSPYPALSPELLDADWSAQRDTTASTPAIKVEQGGDFSSSPHAAALTGGAGTGAMSAVAIPFDTTFSMGSRSAFAWPGIHGATTEASAHFLGHELASLGHGSDASLTPPSVSRSITASPPRASLTPEQRELKRQMDQVRRDSKGASRIRRSSSNAYVPDSSTAMNMPVYTTAAPPISILAEPATTMSSQTYLPSYSHAMQNAPPSTVSSMPSVYQTAYQQPTALQHNYNMGLDYSNAFQHSSSYGRGRPGPMGVGNDSNMMYHVPAVMATGGAGAANEGNHVRVVQSRPKPQCWEHGCNGRQFSTFSNLLRHQREKSGQATKATCPNCGAEFTRTTARNGHLLHDKCKQRRNNSGSGSGDASGSASPSATK